jgi:hypothetical protein
MARIGGGVLIVPARASFLADDQLGYVQAPDFQYLTGLDELVGAVLVLDDRRQERRLRDSDAGTAVHRARDRGGHGEARFTGRQVKTSQEIERSAVVLGFQERTSSSELPVTLKGESP